MSNPLAHHFALAALGLVACRDRSSLAPPALVAQVDAAVAVDAVAQVDAADAASPPEVQAYREAVVVAAKAATVDGTIGSVEAPPGRVTVAWSGTKGLLIHCAEETIDRAHEGEVSRTTCRAAEIAADGALGPLVARLPDEAWLEEAIPDWRARRAAAPSVEAALAKETSLSQFGAPLVTGDAVSLALVSEEISGGAVGGCVTSTSRIGSATVLRSCELWQPRVTAAWRGNRSAVLLEGIEGETFAKLYERYAGGGAESPWVASQRARLVHRTGQGPWQSAAVPLAGDVEALAVHRDLYGIVSRERRPGPRGAPEVATLRASLRPWPPTAAAVAPIVLATANVGGATGAFAANGELVVVWAGRASKRLEAVAIAPGPVARTLPSPAAGSAPSMASAGATMALAYVDPTGAVQLGCGALGATPARVSDKGDAPRVALGPDGSGGIVVWREGPKRLRSRAFRCSASTAHASGGDQGRYD